MTVLRIWLEKCCFKIWQRSVWLFRSMTYCAGDLHIVLKFSLWSPLGTIFWGALVSRVPGRLTWPLGGTDGNMVSRRGKKPGNFRQYLWWQLLLLRSWFQILPRQSYLSGPISPMAQFSFCLSPSSSVLWHTTFSLCSLQALCCQQFTAVVIRWLPLHLLFVLNLSVPLTFPLFISPGWTLFSWLVYLPKYAWW